MILRLTHFRYRYTVFAVLLTLAHSTPAAQSPAARPPNDKPTLFIIGDSTVKNSTRGQVGWGDPIARYFDPQRITSPTRRPTG